MGHLHDLGLMEGVAMGDASLHHLYLELLLVDTAVRAVEELLGGIVNVDNGSRPGGVKVIKEVHGGELVDPNAIIVRPDDL